MRSISVLVSVFTLFLCTLAGAETPERLVVTGVTTNKLIFNCLLQYRDKRYTRQSCVARQLSGTGGLTATRILENGNQEILVTVSEPSGAPFIHRLEVPPGTLTGNDKKLPTRLTSHYNLNSNDDFVSYDFANTVVTQPYNSADLPAGPRDKLYTLPAGADPFDTDYQDYLNRNYASLFYYSTTNRFGVVFGDRSDPTYTSAYQFANDVVSGELLPRNDTTMNFIIVERTPGSPYAKLAIRNRIINTDGFQPEGNPITLIPPAPQNLGTIPYFNMLTVTPSLANPNASHVCYVANNASKTGTELRCFLFNNQTGKKDSPVSRWTVSDDGQIWLYGLNMSPWE